MTCFWQFFWKWHLRFALVCCVGFSSSVLADKPQEQGAKQAPPNEEQGQTEGGDSKETKKRFGKILAVPVIITEPAIGEGLGGGVVYFHKPKVEQEDQSLNVSKITTGREVNKSTKDPKPPPTATGIFGFYTNNDSMALGVGHTNTFLDDTYRILVAAANTRINSKYYLGDFPVNFRLEGNVIYGDGKRRLGETNFFGGLSFSFLDAESRFLTRNESLNDLDILAGDLKDAGLALNLVYDSRDNTMMPIKGGLAELSAWRYDELFGGDFNYWSTKFKSQAFRQFANRYVLGGRFEVSDANGDVPFYAEPYVALRGIPALRFQGQVAGVLELETRAKIAERWSLLAFAGAGFITDGNIPIESESDIYAYGAGFRYLAVKSADAWIGMDFAEGPEEFAWYIQIGQAW